MKRIAIVLIAGLMLVLPTAVFAQNDGANGWSWWTTKTAGASTNTVTYYFIKPTAYGGSPPIMLFYVASTKQWSWGLMNTTRWTNDKAMEVTYFLGQNGMKHDDFFIADGVLLYEPVEDIAEFVTYPVIFMFLRGPGAGQNRYDMTGLSQTIKMAGLSLK